MMADPHSTGFLCLSKTPTPPFVQTGHFYARQQDNIFWIREPNPPGYHVPIADTTKLLAKNVRLERVMRGWSQETLAELAGLNRSFVGAIERCEHNTTLATVEKLAKAFDLSVTELLAPHKFNT
jgi:XRE family transcriptional regulator, regulator of sulfur utilization